MNIEAGCPGMLVAGKKLWKGLKVEVRWLPFQVIEG
jgi:hypothetical protein